ncbi:MAG: PIN domain-containing protein [Caulobacteraceae bacterium]|nr:PIN domain-containing protein [Caulobacteraceae bacterium]
MSASFFDSNVLIYIASEDSTKAELAEDLLAAEQAVISPQVLNECAHVLRRKLRRSWAEIHGFVGQLALTATLHPVTGETTQLGLRLAERHGFSVWDSMIVASALQCDARILWTEDLHDGLLVDGRLRIANPFAGRP